MKNSILKVFTIVACVLVCQNTNSQELCLKIDSIVMYYAPVSSSRMSLSEHDVINLPEYGEKVIVKDSVLLAEFCSLNLVYQQQASPDFSPIDCRVVCLCYVKNIVFYKVIVNKNGLYSIYKNVYYPKKAFNNWLSNFFQEMFPQKD
jgi:hypothetical protein